MEKTTNASYSIISQEEIKKQRQTSSILMGRRLDDNNKSL